MDPLNAAIGVSAVLAIWDYGRRHLKIHAERAEAERARADAVSSMRSLITDTRDDMFNMRERFAALDTQVALMRSRPAKDSETDAAIKQLFERCDKNSTAITNTAEAMQKLFNEKFTAIALARGINQGRVG